MIDNKKFCSCCKNLIKNNKVTDYVIMGKGSYVCNDCAKKINQIYSMSFNQSMDMIDERMNTQISNGAGETVLHSIGDAMYIEKKLYPGVIKRELDRYIVGQDSAKEILAVAAYNHYKRTQLRDPNIKKPNVLLIGPTGSGKTYLVQTLAKILDVPMAIIPATRLTEAGYVGDDVESVVQNLLTVSGGSVEKAERGIIFIDEIDKLTSSSSETKRQVGGKGVQQALLPILEGCTVQIPASGSTQGVSGFAPMVSVDTTNILFICGGAFPDLGNIIRDRLKQGRKMGFSMNSQKDEKQMDMTDNVLSQAVTEDFFKFGIIPELLGRLPVRTSLSPLSVDVLRRILTEPENSLVGQYRKLFAFDNINIVFEDEALTYIAKKAYDEETGARSLLSIMEKSLQKLMYWAPGNMNGQKICISKKYLEEIENGSAELKIAARG